MTPTEIARVNRQTLAQIRRAKLVCGFAIVISVVALAMSTHALGMF